MGVLVLGETSPWGGKALGRQGYCLSRKLPIKRRSGIKRVGVLGRHWPKGIPAIAVRALGLCVASHPTPHSHQKAHTNFGSLPLKPAQKELVWHMQAQ